MELCQRKIKSRAICSRKSGQFVFAIIRAGRYDYLREVALEYAFVIEYLKI